MTFPLITRPHTPEEFHAALAEVIETKSRKKYNFAEFSHINLIVLDWFHMDFNAKGCSTGVLFDGRVREALRATPFREVHLIIYDTDEADPPAEASEQPPTPVRVPLKRLLLFEQFYAASSLIAEVTDCGEDAAFVDKLACGFVTRCLEIGASVTMYGFPHVRFGAPAIGLSETGFTVRDDQDLPHEPAEAAEIVERLSSDQEAALKDRIAQMVLMSGFSENTYEPPSRAAFLRRPSS